MLTLCTASNNMKDAEVKRREMIKKTILQRQEKKCKAGTN